MGQRRRNAAAHPSLIPSPAPLFEDAAETWVFRLPKRGFSSLRGFLFFFFKLRVLGKLSKRHFGSFFRFFLLSRVFLTLDTFWGRGGGLGHKKLLEWFNLILLVSYLCVPLPRPSLDLSPSSSSSFLLGWSSCRCGSSFLLSGAGISAAAAVASGKVRSFHRGREREGRWRCENLFSRRW